MRICAFETHRILVVNGVLTQQMCETHSAVLSRVDRSVQKTTQNTWPLWPYGSHCCALDALPHMHIVLTIPHTTCCMAHVTIPYDVHACAARIRPGNPHSFFVMPDGVFHHGYLFAAVNSCCTLLVAGGVQYLLAAHGTQPCKRQELITTPGHHAKRTLTRMRRRALWRR